MSYAKVAASSKLEELPPDADLKRALMTIQHNFEIIMRALNDMRARIDQIK